MSAIAYPQNTRKPIVGDNECAGPLPKTAAPAFDGRYGLRLFAIDDGSNSVSSGTTKNAPTNAEIAAAVLRRSAPRVSPITPATVTYSAAPTTDRNAPGAVRPTPRW